MGEAPILTNWSLVGEPGELVQQSDYVCWV